MNGALTVFGFAAVYLLLGLATMILYDRYLPGGRELAGLAGLSWPLVWVLSALDLSWRGACWVCGASNRSAADHAAIEFLRKYHQ